MENRDKKLWDFYQNENRDHLKEGYPRQDKILRQVKKYLNKGAKILEIGFGDGYLLNKMSLNGFDVIGQDLSKSNIELTKKQWNNDKIKFILGDDSGKFSFENNSIDCFIASEVLEHMNDEQLKICISEVYRVLKKGGFAIITVPAKENLKANQCICPNCGEVFHKWGHKQYWDDYKIRNEFADFKIVRVKEFFNRYVGKNVLEKIIGYFMYFIRIILNNFISIEGKSYLIILQKL